jgi:hypothetical protein
MSSAVLGIGWSQQLSNSSSNTSRIPISNASSIPKIRNISSSRYKKTYSHWPSTKAKTFVIGSLGLIILMGLITEYSKNYPTIKFDQDFCRDNFQNGFCKLSLANQTNELMYQNKNYHMANITASNQAKNLQEANNHLSNVFVLSFSINVLVAFYLFGRFIP